MLNSTNNLHVYMAFYVDWMKFCQRSEQMDNASLASLHKCQIGVILMQYCACLISFQQLTKLFIITGGSVKVHCTLDVFPLASTQTAAV